MHGYGLCFTFSVSISANMFHSMISADPASSPSTSVYSPSCPSKSAHVLDGIYSVVGGCPRRISGFDRAVCGRITD